MARDQEVGGSNPLAPMSQPGRDPHHGTPTQFFGTNGKSTALIIGETKSTVTDLLAQNAVLLAQVFDGALLLLIEQTRKASDEEREWSEERRHGLEPIIPV